MAARDSFANTDTELRGAREHACGKDEENQTEYVGIFYGASLKATHISLVVFASSAKV
jgi:hypothetical protein